MGLHSTKVWPIVKCEWSINLFFSEMLLLNISILEWTGPIF